MPLGKDFITVVGATGQSEKAYFLKPLKYKLGKQIGIHRFLYLPGAPKSLLGRDMLEQLNATIIFRKAQIEFKIEDTKLTKILSLALIQILEKGEIPQDILDQAYPGVWASGTPGRAKNADPIEIKLKPGARPVKIKQYPLKLEDQRGIKKIIDSFINFGLLV